MSAPAIRVFAFARRRPPAPVLLKPAHHSAHQDGHCCRGALTAGQRRIAYDSLGMYQQLHQAALDPLSPEAWSQTMQYSRTVSAILAADGVRWAGAVGGVAALSTLAACRLTCGASASP